MKYKKIYEVLEQRGSSSPDFAIPIIAGGVPTIVPIWIASVHFGL